MHSLVQRDDRADFLALFLLVALLGIATFYAERIPLNNGYGWDGAIYGQIAQSPESIRDLGPYYLKRVAPSLLAHTTLRVLGYAVDTYHIVWAFRIMNWLMLCAAAYAWLRTLQYMGLSIQLRVLGLGLSFLGHFCLKFIPYYPVQTDAMAYALAIFLVRFWTLGHYFGMLLIMLVGAFTHPLIPVQAGLLFVFPIASPKQQSSLESPHDAAINHNTTRISTIVGICVALIAGAYFGIDRLMLPENWGILLPSCTFAATGLVFAGVHHMQLQRAFLRLGTAIPYVISATYILVAVSLIRHDGVGVSLHGDVPMQHDWRSWLGIAIGAAYVYFVIAFAVDAFRGLGRFDMAATMRRFVVVGVFAMLYVLARRIVSAKSEYGLDNFIRWLTWYSFSTVNSGGAVGLFLLAHTIFIGPAVYLIGVRWRAFWNCARQLGPGAVIWSTLGLLCLLGSESRAYMTFAPLLLLCILSALRDTINLDWPRVFCLLGLCLALSKVWLPLNDGQGQLLRGRYFSSHGPWISDNWYALQLVPVACIVPLIWHLLRGAKETSA